MSEPQAAAFDQRDYARRLALQMLNLREMDAGEKEIFTRQIRVRNREGVEVDRPVSRILKDMIELLWPTETRPKEGEAEQAAFDARQAESDAYRHRLMDDLSGQKDDIQALTIDVMAHAGQLHQMAGMLERERLLTATDENQNPIKKLLRDPHSKRLNYASAADAVKAFGVPAFEMTFTGHPTNTNSVESMRLQRKLAGALMTLGDGAAASKAALKAFAQAPLLPTKDGKPKPLTVPEETDTMLYFFGNVYDDLPGAYKNFDRELDAHYPDYKPDELKLNYQFHSWGSSGDKDGNKKVNGDTTLGAVAAHRTAILSRYAAALETIHTPQAEAVKAAAKNVATVNADIQAALKEKGIFGPTPEESVRQFDTFSASLRAATEDLNLKAFEQEITEAYRTDHNPETLNLLRRVRTFGFSFGHLEYRETAEVYERVVSELIPDYARIMKPLDEAREEYENAVKIKDLALQKTLEEKIVAIKDAIEIRRRDMLVDLIKHPDQLAGRYKAAMEHLRQVAGQPYEDKDGNAIEGAAAYQTLKRMELARDFPDMIQNNVLAECGTSSNMLEALLLQHAVAKDGRRATMGIVPLFEEHATLKTAPKVVRDAMEIDVYQQHLDTVADAQGIKIAQQVQLAHSDNAKRAGVPAARALVYKAHHDLREMMNDFNVQHGTAVAMQFFEGGSQSDAYRGGGRAISASLNEFGLYHFAKMTHQGGDLLNYYNLPFSTERLLTKSLSTQIEGIKQRKQTVFSKLSQSVVAALDEVKSNYIDTLFKSETYLNFLNKIGYALSTLLGNFSSRAASRSGAKTVLTDINSTRAIGISEALQHADIAATWIGTEGIEALLEKHCKESMSAEGRNKMYNQSPIFEDVIDRMMYGLMRSDLRFVEKISSTDGIEHPLMGRFRDEYAAVFRLCMESYTGEKLETLLQDKKYGFSAADLNDPQKLHALVQKDALRQVIREQVFPHVVNTLGDQQRFLDLAHHMQHWSVAKVEDPKTMTDATHKNASLLHNMMDTVHHGRLTLVDDTHYAKIYCDKNGIEREWAEKNIERRQAAAQGRAA